MALTSYPAIFYKEKNGEYSVVFPDLNNISTCGNNLNHAIEMAVECMVGYISLEQEDGEELPNPSDIKDIIPQIDSDGYLPDDIFVNIISADVEEYAKRHFNKSVKKTLTIPYWMDIEAKKRNINFSATLQEALKNKLAQPY